jgi:2,4-dienoyl-CoA reductase-like NADH-dependent reductase (Old Yellow Enzyme family)
MVSSSGVSILFTSKQIGRVQLRNRFVRAATSETMANDDGRITDDLIRLHVNLAKGGVGLAILGHAFVHPGGRASLRQTGMNRDDFVPDLKRLTAAVHENGGKVFAQINHAGSQTGVEGVEPVAPSESRNPVYGKIARALSREEIEKMIDLFGQAARRVREAEFDGVHIHGANGYLISEFSSPYTNKREDEWGGDAERRSRFLFHVYEAVRKAVGPDYPVTLKIGVVDSVTAGLTAEESCARARKLEEMRLDGIEVSLGVMNSYLDNVRKYVAVDGGRAFGDLLFHRMFSEPGKQAYYVPYAEQMRKAVKIPIIIAGGMRSTDVMEGVIESGAADFIAMSRPFVREPDIVHQISEGRRGLVDCTSCNLCLDRDGRNELKCWRKNRVDLLRVLVERLSGQGY